MLVFLADDISAFLYLVALRPLNLAGRSWRHVFLSNKKPRKKIAALGKLLAPLRRPSLKRFFFMKLSLWTTP